MTTSKNPAPSLHPLTGTLLRVLLCVGVLVSLTFQTIFFQNIKALFDPASRILQSLPSSLSSSAAATTSSPLLFPPKIIDDIFCMEWNANDALNRTMQPFDDWWTHHPEYIMHSENETHYCVQRDLKSVTTARMIQFYQNQFHTTCENIHMRYMWSSGWGADFHNVQCGLHQAMARYKFPLVMGFDPNVEPKTWHYSANKKGPSNNATCPQGDLTCYFLPYHGCGPLQDIITKSKNDQIHIIDEGSSDCGEHDTHTIKSDWGWYTNQYITSRRQLWLRRAIYDYQKQIQLFKKSGNSTNNNRNCNVVHVRRADVTLHNIDARKYYTIADYINKLPKERLQYPILLLTDDASAISEAKEFFPNLDFHYFNRTRHVGSSGGWEHQTPSNNPAQEVITILATFNVVQQCDAFVHGPSTFADLIWSVMERGNPNQQHRRNDIHQFEVHAGDDHFRNINNTNSEEELKIKLEQLRQNQQQKREDEEGSKSNTTTNATTAARRKHHRHHLR